MKPPHSLSQILKLEFDLFYYRNRDMCFVGQMNACVDFNVRFYSRHAPSVYSEKAWDCDLNGIKQP